MRATAWPLRWRWVVRLTTAALPATCLVPVRPLEALRTGGRSPCLSSKNDTGIVCRMCDTQTQHLYPVNL